MIWTVRHLWPAGARFAFNCYKHWSQNLLRQPGDPPVTLLRQDMVTQGDPPFMVLYGIALIPLAENLRLEELGILSPFYTDDTDLDRSVWRSAELLKLLM